METSRHVMNGRRGGSRGQLERLRWGVQSATTALLLAFAVSSCSSSGDPADTDEDADHGGENGGGNGQGSGTPSSSYTFGGQSVGFTGGDHLALSGEGYHIFLQTADLYAGVQLRFSTLTQSITPGTFAFVAEPTLPRTEGIEFAGANLGGTEANPLGVEATGGSVTIEATAAGYTVTFDVVTPEGAAQGKYTGALPPR